MFLLTSSSGEYVARPSLKHTLLSLLVSCGPVEEFHMRIYSADAGRRFRCVNPGGPDDPLRMRFLDELEGVEASAERAAAEMAAPASTPASAAPASARPQEGRFRFLEEIDNDENDELGWQYFTSCSFRVVEMLAMFSLDCAVEVEHLSGIMVHDFV